MLVGLPLDCGLEAVLEGFDLGAWWGLGKGLALIERDLLGVGRVEWVENRKVLEEDFCLGCGGMCSVLIEFN